MLGQYNMWENIKKCMHKLPLFLTYGQVWWPILGIRALHLTHPSAHTQQWKHTPGPGTHTRSSGQPFMLRRPGSSWGSVPCSRTPQSWYWGWRERWTFTHPQFLPARDLNSQPLDYEYDSLTIRPWLPPIRFYVSSTIFKTACFSEV